jgi:alkanesulfonate monooxygenase SsuD/methylene tetrahydromethanopterin reductase-like flavin-dependent oxidoreductase (luciferase family)
MLGFSICLTNHNRAFPPHKIAIEIEERGFEGLFLPENSHVPIDRSRTLRKFDGIEKLSKFYDPFITLAACAAVTNNIKLGTSVCLLTQREPEITAKVIASLESISKHRCIIGVAGGFVAEAMENHGSEFTRRWEIVRERVQLMREKWELMNRENKKNSLEAKSFSTPIWIGSNSKNVPDRVAAYADGWLNRRELFKGDPANALKVACQKIGRPLTEITLAMMGASTDADELKISASQGYQHFIYFVSDDNRDDLLRNLDSIAFARHSLLRTS